MISAALAYTSSVPYRPNATPAVQTIRYFHAASSEILVLYDPTRNTVDSVVASMATHIMITLFDVTTKSMVNTNRLKKA